MQIKKTGMWCLFMVVLLAGCRPATATVAPSSAPVSTVVPPSPTPLVTRQTNEGQTLPADAAGVPRITPAELLDLMSSPRKVVIVDVRGHDAYADGHIPGALDLPYAEVEAKHQQLPRTSQIVFYCA